MGFRIYNQSQGSIHSHRVLGYKDEQRTSQWIMLQGFRPDEVSTSQGQ
jgi:hypothetical protein